MNKTKKLVIASTANGQLNLSGIVTSGGFKVGTGISIVGSGVGSNFYGDGSQLTGITAISTLSAGSGSQRVVLTGQTSAQ